MPSRERWCSWWTIHDIVRRTLAALLKEAGFEVVQAGDGVEALEKVEDGPVPTVIVSDIVMPRMDGVELMQSLSDRGIQIPAVLLTGYAEVDSARFTPALEGVSILRKPTSATTLTEAVRRAIDSAPISQRAAS